ncbi:MAG: tetratricopeptide repeat protein, partial [Proteobacteria bacterium]|nr:tetratricopeptide repeat protein [Pseudomonadota bacterium]
ALKLAPNLAEAHLAVGYSDYYGRGDYAAARKAFDAALALRPNDADALAARGYVERREGRFDAAIASLQAALAHDPRNSALANDLGETCMMAGRYADAASWLQRALALDPTNLSAKIDASNVILLRNGDAQGALAAAQGDEPVLQLWRADMLTYQRKYADAIALLDGVPDNADNFSFVRGSKSLQLANLYRLAGESARAQPLYAQARTQAHAELSLQQGGDLATVWSNLAAAELGLGNTQQGLDAIARSQAIVTATGDKVSGAAVMQNNAVHYAQARRADLAVPLLEAALASPGIGFYYSPAMLKIDPAWDAIRDDPRFKELLNTWTADTARP